MYYTIWSWMCHTTAVKFSDRKHSTCHIFITISHNHSTPFYSRLTRTHSSSYAYNTTHRVLSPQWLLVSLSALVREVLTASAVVVTHGDDAVPCFRVKPSRQAGLTHLYGHLGLDRGCSLGQKPHAWPPPPCYSSSFGLMCYFPATSKGVSKV